MLIAEDRHDCEHVAWPLTKILGREDKSPPRRQKRAPDRENDAHTQRQTGYDRIAVKDNQRGIEEVNPDDVEADEPGEVTGGDKQDRT
jgi:hypothetical protein